MEPRPKQTPSQVSPVQWPARGIIHAIGFPPPEGSFAEVLARRRSTRATSRCSIQTLTSAISFATRSLYVRQAADAERFRRPSPSAGGLHPIHVLISPPSGASRVLLADPDRDRLIRLAIAAPDQLAAIRRQRQAMLPHARGYFVVFAANLELLDAHYENPETLLWRDAGALAQTLALTFEAYRLKSCLMGVSGQEMLKAVGMDGKLTAAGAMIVGASQ